MKTRTIQEKKPYTVTVREKHCKTATRCDSNMCIFAQALVDTVPGAVTSSVNKTRTQVMLVNGDKREWMTPASAKRALAEFDNTGAWGDIVGRDFTFLPVPKSLTTKALRESARRKAKARKALGIPATYYPNKTGRNTASKRAVTAVKKRMMLDELLNG